MATKIMKASMSQGKAAGQTAQAVTGTQTRVNGSRRVGRGSARWESQGVIAETALALQRQPKVTKRILDADISAACGAHEDRQPQKHLREEDWHYRTSRRTSLSRVAHFRELNRFA